MSPEPFARSLWRDIHLLGDLLEEVKQANSGSAALEVEENALALAEAFRAGRTEAGEELAALLADAPLDTVEALVRAYTRYLQLTNLAEDNDRIRRLRREEVERLPRPRPGSLGEAVRTLARSGVDASRVEALLADAELRLVLTAHPTEARRRSTIEKLARIFASLRELDARRLLPREERAVRERLAATIEELWSSDDTRSASPSVRDEVMAGLAYFRSTLADVVALIYRELESAIADAYPREAIAVSPLLSFGSWIGGDRDGNPHVTPDVTVEALELMRESCVSFLEERVVALAPRLSVSRQVTGDPPLLRPLLADLATGLPELAGDLQREHPHEPYRRALILFAERLRLTRQGSPRGYAGPTELAGSLRLVERSLCEQGQRFLPSADLRDLIHQVEVFGFHFATLDIRDQATRHTAAVGELLAASGVTDGYEELPERKRLALLARQVGSEGQLAGRDLSVLSTESRVVVETFRRLAAALRGDHAGAVRSYVISHTASACDVMEVLLLMKESGLAGAGGSGAMLRIVPLLESSRALERATDILGQLLDVPAYRAALTAVGDNQEVMIGYSDSNKEVGYLSSVWATHRAQVELASLFRARGVGVTFFHGRGGSVGRGGGPSNRAILGQAPGTVNGRIKVTEQGEVVSAKYSTPEIGHRELELATSAVLLSALDAVPHPEPDRMSVFQATLDRMARRSSAAYRELVYEDPGFETFFHGATPIEEVTRLRIGSRPARRSDTRGIDDLRSIAWVFAWTQTRIILPAWYGLGTALAAAREEGGLELLQEMRRSWPFFAGLLSNAEMALAKTDLGIGGRYAALVEDEEVRERIWGRIQTEHETAVGELLAVSEQARLLDGEVHIQRSVRQRNPYVDPLSFAQLELLRRTRAGDTGSQTERASSLAINGIAGGLRNTG